MSWKMSRALEAYLVVLLVVVRGLEIAAVVVVVLLLLVFTCENGLGDREGKDSFCSPIVGGL